MKKSFKTIPCLSDNRSVIETFDVVSTDSKLPITYYKTKTLQIQEDFSKFKKSNRNNTKHPQSLMITLVPLLWKDWNQSEKYKIFVLLN